MAANKTDKQKSLTDKKLIDLKAKGLSDAEIAKRYGYTRVGIYQRRRRLEVKNSSVITQDKARELVDHQLSDLQLLQKTAVVADEILDRFRKIANEEVDYSCPNCQQLHKGFNQQAVDNVFKATADLKAFINTKVNVANALTNMRAIETFMDIVLQEINLLDPKARERIIANLSRRRLSLPLTD